MGQARDYATRLGSRFAYASNSLHWYGIDMTTGAEGNLTLPFPSPDELWSRTFPNPNPWRDRFGAVPFETDGGKWDLRYYQHNAITAVLEAVAKGDRRILLTLATGIGKTSIAIQIAWKLFQAKWNLSGEPTRRPRILFLAYRNILADQAYNAFSAFPNDAVTRIDPDTIRKNRSKPPKNASLFFTIFQTFMTGEDTPVYQQYEPDFFDFIVIDECHRGGAKDESEWHSLLEYFAPTVPHGVTPDIRTHLLKQLEDNGYDADRLEDIRQLVDAEQSDLFDVLAYVLFTNQPRTRQDGATTVRDHRMDSFDREMVDLLLSILKAYEMNGEGELATKKSGQFLTARYGSVSESKGKLGELATVRDAFRRMQIALYAE